MSRFRSWFQGLLTVLLLLLGWLPIEPFTADGSSVDFFVTDMIGDLGGTASSDGAADGDDLLDGGAATGDDTFDAGELDDDPLDGTVFGNDVVDDPFADDPLADDPFADLTNPTAGNTVARTPAVRATRIPLAPRVPVARAPRIPRATRVPVATRTPVPTAIPTPTIPNLLRGRRFNDPVLRWLPEIEAAASAAGVPATLVAGVMRVTSNGDPNVIFPNGFRGLIRVPESEFNNRGIVERLWNDPVTNLEVGAALLSGVFGQTGDERIALLQYVGSYCNPEVGSCAGDYVDAAAAWSAFYAVALERPKVSGLTPLPGFRGVPYEPFVLTQPTPAEFPPAIDDGGTDGGGEPIVPTVTPDAGDAAINGGVIVENDTVVVTRDEDGELTVDVTLPGETPEADRPRRTGRRPRGAGTADPAAAVVETPVVEPPVVETPVSEAPVADPPVAEQPPVETSIIETPIPG